jgi:hypothetical protein
VKERREGEWKRGMQGGKERERGIRVNERERGWVWNGSVEGWGSNKNEFEKWK